MRALPVAVLRDLWGEAEAIGACWLKKYWQTRICAPCLVLSISKPRATYLLYYFLQLACRWPDPSNLLAERSRRVPGASLKKCLKQQGMRRKLKKPSLSLARRFYSFSQKQAVYVWCSTTGFQLCWHLSIDGEIRLRKLTIY